jgi:hypothetical protein
MRIERHTIPFEKTGENIFEKGDVVFEAKAPAAFKVEHIMVTSDIEYPRWYTWLGALRWMCFPWLVRSKLLIGWKDHVFWGLRLVWPFRALQQWLFLRRKRAVLGGIMVKSVLLNEAEGLLIPIPLLSITGETMLYTNLPPVRPGTALRVVFRGQPPKLTVYAVGFVIFGL